MIDTSNFLNAMDKIDTGFRELMDLLKEHEFPEVSNGVRHYYAEDGKLPFQESQQFDRPDEFLQALLDMLKVQFEPWPLGTFFLNSNVMAYLADTIEKRSFDFGYASVTSEPQTDFTSFWLKIVEPYLDKLGYPLEGGVMYVAVVVGRANYSIQLIEEINGVLGTGLTLSSAVKSVLSSEPEKKDIYVGFGLEEGASERLRVSMWCMHPYKP